MNITSSMLLSDVVYRLMTAKRIRGTELARQADVPQPTVQRIIAGTTTNPHRNTLEAIARYFSISVEQLKGLDPIPWLEPTSSSAEGWSQVPLLTWEQAAEYVENTDFPSDGESVFTDSKVSANAFALRMKDASMEPQFPKDTILIIDPNKVAKDRSYVVVRLANYAEVIFRQLLIDEPHRYLKPLSPDLEHFQMSSLDKDDKVIGVLLQARHNFDEE